MEPKSTKRNQEISSNEFSPGLRRFAETSETSSVPKLSLSLKLRRDHVEQFKNLAELRGRNYTDMIEEFIENAIENPSSTHESDAIADLKSELCEVRQELKTLRAEVSSHPTLDNNNDDFENPLDRAMHNCMLDAIERDRKEQIIKKARELGF